MKKLIAILLVVILCSGCSTPATNTEVTENIVQTIYNFDMDCFEYNLGYHTLKLWLKEGVAPNNEKPFRYFLYEDYAYLQHRLPDTDITLIYEYPGEDYVIHATADYTRYWQLDEQQPYHALKKEATKGWEDRDIDWADHAGLTIPDFEEIDGIGVIRDNVMDTDYTLLSSTLEGDKLSHGRLVDHNLRKKQINATIAYEPSSGRPIKCALYDDMCSFLYKKYKRQSCAYEIKFYSRSEYLFGEKTADWNSMIVTGPATTSPAIFEKIAKHETITYGDFEREVVGTLYAPYGVIMEDLAELGYSQLAIQY